MILLSVKMSCVCVSLCVNVCGVHMSVRKSTSSVYAVHSHVCGVFTCVQCVHKHVYSVCSVHSHVCGVFTHVCGAFTRV